MLRFTEVFDGDKPYVLPYILSIFYLCNVRENVSRARLFGEYGYYIGNTLLHG